TAERLNVPGLAMRGHLALEITFMHMGQFAPAVGHFERVLSLYEPERHLDDAFFYALNPGIAMRCCAAWALWHLGLSDQASMRMQEGLRIAHEVGEPHGLAHALVFASTIHQLRRD